MRTGARTWRDVLVRQPEFNRGNGALIPARAAVSSTVDHLPFANAIAIPLVSWAVTPLALIGAALATLPVHWRDRRTHVRPRQRIFATLARPCSGWLHFMGGAARRNAAVRANRARSDRLVWLLGRPAGRCVRSVSPRCCRCSFGPRSSGHGSLVTALDVGQGSALLIERASRMAIRRRAALSSDSDAGERIVLPYLRHRGIGRSTG